MSERTEGLWASSPHPADDTIWIVHVLGDEFHVICVTSQGNDEANAHFLAAAPETARQRDELLAACKGLLLDTVNMDCRNNGRRECDCAFCKARAAIANATKPEGADDGQQ